MIPSEAVGLYADDANNPLAYVENVSVPSFVFDIIEKTNNRMVLQQPAINHGTSPNYLGAIVSADGSEVYWINNLIV